ncbi:MAG: hypothetical protein HYV09_02640 [Deltaproteobacteria bacterium]|nr:hypothetical protein [Deltaproteobacteria bacterium]
MNRRACLLTLLAAGCDRRPRRPEESGPVDPPAITRPPYAALRARIAAIRDEHAENHASATDDVARRAAVADARKALQGALAEVLLPAWLGTRWSFHGTADEPLATQGIACGYFVATLLQHVGLALESRRRFAQSTALRIARSLVPAGVSHHRVFSVPATTLEQKVRSFGDGVHLIGLDVHVGFVIVEGVDGGAVRFVHANYLQPRVVVSEPITASEAIDRSRGAGYHVTSLFGGDRLVRAWLDKSPIPLAAPAGQVPA